MMYNELNGKKIKKVVDKVIFKKDQITAKRIFRMVEQEMMSFDNAIQRNLVWDIERKSLLIHSIVIGIPINPMLGIDCGNGVTDMLDGKQRILGTIVSFYRGEFALKGLDEIPVEMEDGTYEEIDLNGAKYDDLPEMIKEIIDSYNFDVYVLDADTMEEWVNQMFFRWNNGKPLTNVELTRATAKSQDKIMKLAAHALFNRALTPKMLEGYKNEDVVVKAYMMLNSDEAPALETKDIRKITPSLRITEEDVDDLIEVFDRINEVYDCIQNEEVSADGDEKKEKKLLKNKEKIAKKVFSRTNMISIIPFVQKSILDKLTTEEFAGWFKKFFAAEQKGASISAIYNECARAGSMKKTSVKKRNDEIEKHYSMWFKKLLATNSEIKTRAKITNIKPEPEGAIVRADVVEAYEAMRNNVAEAANTVVEVAVETAPAEPKMTAENEAESVAGLVDELVEAVEVNHETEQEEDIASAMNEPEAAA